MSSTKLHSIIPKLPSKNLGATKAFYEKLNFHQVGGTYPDYLMMNRDEIEIHFFLFNELNVLENYGMCYVRVMDIDALYNEIVGLGKGIRLLGKPETKPWKQKEFAITDCDHNLLTFGESL
jgi:hypothetical protein